MRNRGNDRQRRQAEENYDGAVIAAMRAEKASCTRPSHAATTKALRAREAASAAYAAMQQAR